MEDLKASEKLRTFSGESPDLRKKPIHLGKEAEQVICKYNDYLMSTGNTDLEWEKQSLHSFELPYSQVTNFELDYVNLVYVLYCYKNGQQMCRFNFPQEFCNATYLRYEKIKLRNNDCDCRPITVSNKMILVLIGISNYTC